MRTPLVVGNWKMHGTVAESRTLATAIRGGLKRPRGVEVVSCPPFTALIAVSEVVTGTPIGLGAQNCHYEPSGAHTGEIAPRCWWSSGPRRARRAFGAPARDGETDELVNRNSWRRSGTA